jgi:glycosyltransferase involved in cell wall biosynthesis
MRGIARSTGLSSHDLPDLHPGRDAVGKPILLYVVNVAWFFRLHRLHFALAAKRAGYDVHLATAPETCLDVQEIRDAGVIVHEIKLTRGVSTVADEARLVLSLFRLHRTLRPAIVHNVTVKPVLWGTLAARAGGKAAIVNSMSGLGTLFSFSGFRAAIGRSLITAAYRLLFGRADIRVIFENQDDFSLFLKKRIVAGGQATLIRGAGVDLNKFVDARMRGGIPVVVLPARMLWTKGVGEFCAAARLAQQAGIVARFVLVGRADPENPSAVPVEWLAGQQRMGFVEWWGHRDDMCAVYSGADIVCLPSYREGLPTVLLEGAACGCALVATDVPGCREVVQNEQTGLLVPLRNAEALARALSVLVRNADMRLRLAQAASRKVREEFSVERVQRETLGVYAQLVGGACGEVRKTREASGP